MLKVYSIIFTLPNKLFFLFLAFLLYYFQIFLLLLRFNYLASSLLVTSSLFCLRGLGVKVFILKSNQSNTNTKRRSLYIANHGSPLDIFLIQGIWKIQTITTAHTHLSIILPFINKSLINFGHIPFDYLNKKSRLNAFYKAKNSIIKNNKFFIYPSGSLITPLSSRFSNSVSTLAIDTESVVIPCKVSYSSNIKSLYEFNYRPFKLIFSLIFSTNNFIIVSYLDPVDPRNFDSNSGLTKYLQNLYC